MEHRLATIVFIDMQGYTKRSAGQTLEEMKRFHDEFQSFVKERLDKHGGMLVKSLGDGFLARFDAPTKAVACALEMQSMLSARNEEILNPEKIVRFRIGINTGEIGVDESGDVFGDPVNIASRIQNFAEPNEVFISEATYLAMNRNEFGAEDLGSHEFKNATREIKVYKVLPKGAKPSNAGAKPAPVAASIVPIAAAGGGASPGMTWKRKAGIAAGILLLLLVVAKAVNKARHRSDRRATSSTHATTVTPGTPAPPATPDRPAPPAPPAVPGGEPDGAADDGDAPDAIDERFLDSLAAATATEGPAADLKRTLEGVRDDMKAGRNDQALAALETLERRFRGGLEKRPRVAAQLYATKATLLGRLGRRREAREAFREAMILKRRDAGGRGERP